MARFIITEDSIEDLIWRYGRPKDWLISHLDFVGNFIKQHELKPLPVAKPAAAEARAEARIWSPDIRGGIRIAHLHFGGQVYMLNEKAWGELSTAVVGMLAEKLSKAKAGKVGFEELMDVAEAAERL